MAGNTEIALAVALLRAGRLLAFPTETVYGLGADARNSSAVRSIFRLKGRPAEHPLIVHLPPRSVFGEQTSWAAAVSTWGLLPDAGETLARAFWPGPLTMIVQRAAGVPEEVTGGLETVGLRVPSHPVAMELLRTLANSAAGSSSEGQVGLAAPSANRFGHVSPTTAEHVAGEFGGVLLPLGQIASPAGLQQGVLGGILDGGAAQVGLESTIIDLSGAVPRLLRPGAVTLEQIQAVLGDAVLVPQAGAESPRAPGTLAQHYAPRARVEIVAAEEISVRQAALGALGQRALPLQLPEEQAAAARLLYARLRELDEAGADVVLAVLPQGGGLAAAIRDRLRRAAGLGDLPDLP